MILACVCGEDLANAQRHAVWAEGGIACEYRTCRVCKSTRAFAPVDVIPGRRVVCYPDPDTSEVGDEWEALLDALECPPPGPRATLVRNGVTLARTYAGWDGVLGWNVEAPTDETIKCGKPSVYKRPDGKPHHGPAIPCHLPQGHTGDCE